MGLTEYLALGGTIVGSLASAIVFLYRELAAQRSRDQARILKLEAELEAAQTARIRTAEDSVAFARATQKDQQEQTEKLASIVEAMQKGGRRP